MKDLFIKYMAEQSFPKSCCPYLSRVIVYTCYIILIDSVVCVPALLPGQHVHTQQEDGIGSRFRPPGGNRVFFRWFDIPNGMSDGVRS